MKLETRMKNTDTYHFYNNNPKGRFTGDCVIRSLALGLNQDYAVTARELLETSLSTGYGINTPDCYSRYLESKGWKKYPQPRKQDGKKFRGREFVKTCEEPTIAHLGSHHIACIQNQQVWDTWDSSHGCVGNYWRKG